MVVVVFAFLAEFIFPNVTKNVLNFAINPFWRLGGGTADFIHDATFVLSSKKSLILENENLKNEFLTQNALLARLAILSEDNARMKVLLNRASTTNMMVASVLRRPPASPYDTLVLDAGSVDGVKNGARVFAPGRVLIGTVSSVSYNSSVVDLYSYPNKKTDVVLGESSISAVAVGRGGGNFRIELPVETGVDVGEHVKAPGISSELFGVVERIDRDSTDSIQTIYFKNSFNIFNLDFVEIEKI
jgi:rod shape-determining protein MreC